MSPTHMLTKATLILAAAAWGMAAAQSGGIPALSWKTPGGPDTSLADLPDRPVLVVVADTGAQSRAALSSLAGVFDHYRGSELAIAAFAPGTTDSGAAAMADEQWLTYPLHGDSARSVAAALGIKHLPGFAVLDNSHHIRATDTFDSARVHAALRRWMRQKVIVVTARKFQYDPSEIRVNRGDRVLIKMTSLDVTHGMYIDGYDRYVRQYLDRDAAVIPPEKAQTHILPGELGMLAFTADKAGRFAIRCAATCGEFHPYMIGRLRVEPAVLFPVGAAVAGLLSILSLILFALRISRPAAASPVRERLLGIIPLDWRFELTKFKPVRAVLKSRLFPLALILCNLAVFTVILAATFIGGFTGAGNYNFGVMIVWILWWVLLMVFMVPFIGRFWCMMCPFPLIGDWIQRGKLFLVGSLKSRGLALRWPNRWRNLWPLVILFFVSTWFSAFFTVRPMATFILLSSIIGLAIIIGILFEKRTFCLFVCPVSGFQGLYANFSACEIRRKDPAVCRAHKTKTCVTGNEKGYGCPWMEMPFDMNRNTYCGMCMECFKTCPHDNMALNIRPFGADLLSDRRKTDDLYHRRGTDEAFKAFSMIGIFFAFFMAFQGADGGLKDMARATTVRGFLTYIAELTVTDFLLVPGVFLLFAVIAKVLSHDRAAKVKNVFVNMSACLIPMGLAVWAGFSAGVVLPNGSYVLHVISDPFAWGWNLFGTANIPWTPVFTVVTPYVQCTLAVLGLMLALDFGAKIAMRTFSTPAKALRGWIPMAVCLTGFTVAFMWLFAG